MIVKEYVLSTPLVIVARLFFFSFMKFLISIQKTATKIGSRKHGKTSPTNSTTEISCINFNFPKTSTRNVAITQIDACYNGLFHIGWYLCLLLQIAFYTGWNQLRTTVHAVFHCFPKIFSKCVKKNMFVCVLQLGVSLQTNKQK